MGVVLMKMMLFGTMQGLFQLINLWVVYTAYATMHFCAVLIYLIMCIFDFLFLLVDWKRLALYYNNGGSTANNNPSTDPAPQYGDSDSS